jgi:hypothetical protein
MKQQPNIYGLMAEFATPEQLLEAAQHTHDAGYTRIDAFAPYPIEGLAHAVGFHGTRLPLVGHSGRRFRVRAAVLRRSRELPDQRRRQADEQLAGVHSGDV